jgi:DUF438 domain-containing protein
MANRVRKLKIFIGRAESNLPSFSGRLLWTVVSASSRQSALVLLQSSKIKCSKRDFANWTEQDKDMNYYFVRKPGIWQSTVTSPNGYEDYEEIGETA